MNPRTALNHLLADAINIQFKAFKFELIGVTYGQIVGSNELTLATGSINIALLTPSPSIFLGVS